MLALLLAMLVLVSCAQTPAEQVVESEYEGYVDAMPLVEISEEPVALAETPVAAEAEALAETTPVPVPALPISRFSIRSCRFMRWDTCSEPVSCTVLF